MTKVKYLIGLCLICTTITAASCRSNPHQEEPCGPKPANCDYPWPPQDPPRN